MESPDTMSGGFFYLALAEQKLKRTLIMITAVLLLVITVHTCRQFRSRPKMFQSSEQKIKRQSYLSHLEELPGNTMLFRH